MPDNRLQLRVAPKFEQIREKNVDVDTDIDIAVNAKLTGLGIAGVATLGLGAIGLMVGAVTFLATYPSNWTPATVEMSVLSLSAGVMCLFLGASMFFHGRTILGSGSVQHMHVDTVAEPEGFPGALAAAPAAASITSFNGAQAANPTAGFVYPEHVEDPWQEEQA